MESKKTELKIIGMARVEDTNRYKINTSNGWMSAFMNEGDSLIEDLLSHQKQLITVGVSHKEDTQYYNIRKFYGIVVKQDGLELSNGMVIDESPLNTTPKEKPLMRKTVQGTAYEKDPVGLAVKVFNTLVEAKAYDMAIDNMDAAIEIVKQAQKAFN